MGSGTLNAGVATFTTSILSHGSNPITATYNADATFGISTSAPLLEVVNTIPSSTTLTSLINPAVYGQQLTFTATVSGAGGPPTGVVILLDNGSPIGEISLNSNGVATFGPSPLNVGSHPITAQYESDGTFSSSTSQAIVQIINGKPTAVTLSSSLNPALSGQSVTFTATVTGPVGPPTGTVTFLDGATSLGVSTLNGNGMATFTTSSLSVGSHSILVAYGGDTSFAGGTSTAVSQSVYIAAFAPVTTSPFVIAGQTVIINLTAMQASGSNLSFALGCAGLPSKSTCQFSSNPFTPGPLPNGSTVQLTFGTSSSNLPPQPLNWNPWPWGALMILGALALTAIGFPTGGNATPRRLVFGSYLTVMALAALLIGCGGSGNSASTYTGTPKGAATFTVTGTSGTIAISTQVTVTVQ